MTEEEKTTEDTQTDEPRMVPETALSKQASDFRAELKARDAQISELTEYRAGIEASQKAKEEAKAKEAGEYQKLIDAKATELDEAQAKIVTLQKQAVESIARAALDDAGMRDKLTQTGALSSLPADATAETVGDWVTKVKELNPNNFVTPPNPTTQPRAGTPVSVGGGGSLEGRLNSADPAVRRDALKEQLGNELSGKS